MVVKGGSKLRDPNKDFIDKLNRVSLPPGVQGDKIGVLQLRVPTCTITTIHLDDIYKKNNGDNFPKSPAKTASRSSLLTPKFKSNKHNSKNLTEISSRIVRLGIHFWGHTSWINLTPNESVVNGTATPHKDNRGKKDLKQEASAQEYSLVGSWVGLRRYFSDMDTLPIKVLLSSSEHEENLKVIGLSKLHLQLPESTLFQSCSGDYNDPTIMSSSSDSYSSRCYGNKNHDADLSFFSFCQVLKIATLNDNELSPTSSIIGEATIEVSFWIRNSTLLTLTTTIATTTRLEKKQQKQQEPHKIDKEDETLNYTKLLSKEEYDEIEEIDLLSDFCFTNDDHEMSEKIVRSSSSSSQKKSSSSFVNEKEYGEKSSKMAKYSNNEENSAKENNLLTEIFEKVNFLKQEFDNGIEAEGCDNSSPKKSFLLEEEEDIDNSRVLDEDQELRRQKQQNIKNVTYNNYDWTTDKNTLYSGSQNDYFPMFNTPSSSKRRPQPHCKAEVLSDLLHDIETSKLLVSTLSSGKGDRGKNSTILLSKALKAPTSNNEDAVMYPRERKSLLRSKFLKSPEQIWFSIIVRELSDLDCSISLLLDRLLASSISRDNKVLLQQQQLERVHVKSIRIVANYSTNNYSHLEENERSKGISSSSSLVSSSEKTIQDDQFMPSTKQGFYGIPNLNLVLQNSFTNTANGDTMSSTNEDYEEKGELKINQQSIVFEIWVTTINHLQQFQKKIRKLKSKSRDGDQEKEQKLVVQEEILLGTSKLNLSLNTSYLLEQQQQLKRSGVPPIIDHKCLAIIANNQQQKNIQIGSINVTLAMGSLRRHGHSILGMDQKSKLIQTWWRKRKQHNFVVSQIEEQHYHCKDDIERDEKIKIKISESSSSRCLENKFSGENMVNLNTNSCREKKNHKKKSNFFKSLRIEKKSDVKLISATRVIQRQWPGKKRHPSNNKKVDHEISNIDIIPSCLDEDNTSVISAVTLSSSGCYTNASSLRKKRKNDNNLKYILEIRPEGICNSSSERGELTRSSTQNSKNHGCFLHYFTETTSSTRKIMKTNSTDEGKYNCKNIKEHSVWWDGTTSTFNGTSRHTFHFNHPYQLLDAICCCNNRPLDNLDNLSIHHYNHDKQQQQQQRGMQIRLSLKQLDNFRTKTTTGNFCQPYLALGFISIEELSSFLQSSSSSSSSTASSSSTKSFSKYEKSITIPLITADVDQHSKSWMRLPNILSLTFSLTIEPKSLAILRRTALSSLSKHLKLDKTNENDQSVTNLNGNSKIEKSLSKQCKLSINHNEILIIRLDKSDGLREMLLFWYDRYHPSSYTRSSHNFEKENNDKTITLKDLLSSGVFVSFDIFCGSDNRSETKKFQTKIIPFDALCDCHFGFTAEVCLFMESKALIKYLRADELIFTLWFVPILTKNTQSDAYNILEDCFKICSTNVSLDYLLSTKNEGYSKKTPWKISLMGGEKGDPEIYEKTEIGFTHIDIHWEAPTSNLCNSSSHKTCNFSISDSNLTAKNIKKNTDDYTNITPSSCENASLKKSFPSHLEREKVCKQNERADCHCLQSNFPKHSSSFCNCCGRKDGHNPGFPNTPKKEDQSKAADDSDVIPFRLPSMFVPTNILKKATITTTPPCDFVNNNMPSIKNQQINVISSSESGKNAVDIYISENLSDALESLYESLHPKLIKLDQISQQNEETIATLPVLPSNEHLTILNNPPTTHDDTFSQFSHQDTIIISEINEKNKMCFSNSISKNNDSSFSSDFSVGSFLDDETTMTREDETTVVDNNLSISNIMESLDDIQRSLDQRRNFA